MPVESLIHLFQGVKDAIHNRDKKAFEIGLNESLNALQEALKGMDLNWGKTPESINAQIKSVLSMDPGSNANLLALQDILKNEKEDEIALLVFVISLYRYDWGKVGIHIPKYELGEMGFAIAQVFNKQAEESSRYDLSFLSLQPSNQFGWGKFPKKKDSALFLSNYFTAMHTYGWIDDDPNWTPYFTEQDKKQFKIKRHPDNFLYCSRPDNKLIDGESLYILSPKGGLYAIPKRLVLDRHIHHSSVRAGQPIIMGGFITVKAGKIIAITNDSGHYRPDNRAFIMGCLYLHEQGILEEDCSVQLHHRSVLYEEGTVTCADLLKDEKYAYLVAEYKRLAENSVRIEDIEVGKFYQGARPQAKSFFQEKSASSVDLGADRAAMDRAYNQGQYEQVYSLFKELKLDQQPIKPDHADLYLIAMKSLNALHANEEMLSLAEETMAHGFKVAQRKSIIIYMIQSMLKAPPLEGELDHYQRIFNFCCKHHEFIKEHVGKELKEEFAQLATLLHCDPNDLIKKGNEKVDKGDWDGAICHFQDAIKISWIANFSVKQQADLAMKLLAASFKAKKIIENLDYVENLITRNGGQFGNLTKRFILYYLIQGGANELSELRDGASKKHEVFIKKILDIWELEEEFIKQDRKLKLQEAKAYLETLLPPPSPDDTAEAYPMSL